MKKPVLQRFLNSYRIKKKLTLTLIPIILLTYFVSICSTYFISFHETKEVVDSQANIVAKQKIQLVDSYLSQLRIETEVFMFNTSFQKQLRIDRSTLSYSQQEELDTDIREYMYNMIIDYDMYIESITLVNNYSDIYLWKMDNRLQHSEFTNRIASITEQTRALNGSILYSYDKLEQGVITLSRLIKDPGADKEIGIMMIDFNLGFLRSMTSSQTSDLGTADILLAIINENGDAIYNSSPISDDQLKALDSDNVDLYFNGDQYQINRTESDHNSWILYTIVNETDLYRNINRTFLLQLFLILVSLLLVFFSIILISDRISRQFQHFIETVSHTTAPNKQALITVDSHDEFRDLAQVYNDMILRINHLIDTVYTKELLHKGAELKALQAQINPHFLYNTLECINSLVELNHPDDVKKTVTALAGIMRMSIKGEEIITVRENLHYVQQYMFIEQLRSGDKLIFLSEIPESIMDYYIPKLTIQPILENSIIHGVSEILGKGMIGLFGRETESSIIFTIKDNGCGFPEDVIERVEHSIADDFISINDTRESIGLFNIQKRIHLMYGTDYGLHIENLPSGGSSVTVCFPKLTSTDTAAAEKEERSQEP